MPPIVISFHSSPPGLHRTSKLLTPLSPTRPIARLPSASARRPPQFFTYSKTETDKTSKPEAISTSVPSAATLPSPPPSSGSSASGSTTHRRRKPKTSAIEPSIDGASLTPLLQPILLRCLARPASDDHTMSTPKKSKSSLNPVGENKKRAVQPYNPVTDLGNDRSTLPSPREILKAQRLEEEKVRAKKESAAAARAAIAAKRKKNGKTRGGSGQAAETRSASPVKDDEKDKDMVPAIVTGPASHESSPSAGPPSRMGLKRTRSNGLLNISTTTATALSSSGIAVGSPLKAVMGPEDEENDGREPKRSRPSTEDVPAARSSRRANTLSPQSSASLALPDDAATPKTYPLAAAKLAPRSTVRSTSVQGGRTDSPALGTASMRRVVSAAGLTGRSRLGSAGPEGTARERSRREVNLPRALRDYDMRAGAMA